MILGLIAYAENTGLGTLSLDFYKNLPPQKVMALDRSVSRGNKFYKNLFPGAMVVKGLPSIVEVDEFLNGLDAVLIFEVPPTDILIRRARQRGIKTVIIPNFEYCPYVVNPNRARPDLLAAPSLWRFDEYPGPKVHIPVPITPKFLELPQRQNKTAKKFLHVGGRPVYPDRNGTRSVFECLKYVTEEIQITITCTNVEYIKGLAKEFRHLIPDNVDYEIIGGEIKDMDRLYKEYDAVVFPRRFCGLSLPLNEAVGYGLPVIMTDISPNNQWLPEEWLVPAGKIAERRFNTQIDVYNADKRLLAARIDEWARNQRTYARVAEQARGLAVEYSWDNLRARYVKILQQLCYHKR